MFTNTYLPHVGGVAKSIACFKQDLQKLGHQVLVIAPSYATDETKTDKTNPDPTKTDTTKTDTTKTDEPETDEKQETDVVRLPAIQKFNGSDFSVRIPLPLIVANAVDEFIPDIIHSHHPFLIGDAAMRTARKRGIPIVFTHHTLYERYTHYTPVDSPVMKRFAAELSTQYANLCDHIIAPSESIRDLIQSRGVKKPIEVIPTGVDLKFFSNGRGHRFRKKHNIALDAFVVGHVGRLALEKNLDYLTRAAAMFLKKNSRAVFVVVGDGTAVDEIQQICEAKGVLHQLIMTGSQTGQDLADAYSAFDLFAFASKTETQGMVLTEAMAAGTPVIAVEASGVREVVRDGKNGRMLDENTSFEEFARCLEDVFHDQKSINAWKAAALQTAMDFSREKSAKRLDRLYCSLVDCNAPMSIIENKIEDEEITVWDDLLTTIDVEWGLLVEKAKALVNSASGPDDEKVNALNSDKIS